MNDGVMGLERHGAGVVFRKGDVVPRMSVPSGDFDDKGEGEEGVYDGGYVAALWDCKRAILYR